MSMKKNEFGIHFGALAPRIKAQLKEQKLKLPGKMSSNVQLVADAISLLKIHSYMRDGEALRARKKLLKYITKNLTPLT